MNSFADVVSLDKGANEFLFIKKLNIIIFVYKAKNYFVASNFLIANFYYFGIKVL